MPSKKNKASSSKVVTNKKPAKDSKSGAKKAATKKPPLKKLAKPSKPVAKNKPVVKKQVKKTVPVKKVAAKAPAKKASKVKPVAKAKAPAKKIIAKPVAKKVARVAEPKKALAKKSEVKKPIVNNKQTHAAKETPKPVEKKGMLVEKPKKAIDPFVKKQVNERLVTDVLAISNTIPVKQKNEISASKIASISNSITNPVKKTDSYAVKPEKEPNGKFELEFVIHASAEMLYEFLSTPSGLSEWFCDDLNIRNGIYTFIWDDQLQQARLLKTVDVHLVRFQWVDKTDGSYFEFRIQRDDLTNDIALIITDFADSVSDRESSKLLWHSQIEKLMHVIGSIF